MVPSRKPAQKKEVYNKKEKKKETDIHANGNEVGGTPMRGCVVPSEKPAQNNNEPWSKSNKYILPFTREKLSDPKDVKQLKNGRFQTPKDDRKGQKGAPPRGGRNGDGNSLNSLKHKLVNGAGNVKSNSWGTDQC